MTHLSRREFATLAASAAVAPLALRQAPVRAAAITAQELFDRIKAQIGVAWEAETVATPSSFQPLAADLTSSSSASG